MKKTKATLFAAFLALFWAAPLKAQVFQDVGLITFPTSAQGEAQQRFLRGVAILHSFGWKQAREQFHAAQEIDPDFAMAYWGESLAYNHPLVSRMDPTEPRAALRRLAPTPEERMAKAPTDREKGFLKAVEVLWGEGEHADRRVGYMEAMRELHEAYPDDPEVAAFYSLSLLGAVAATEDISMRLNVRAGKIALDLLAENPIHPGAAHYAIHAFDNPLMAPLALDAAHSFANIAPAVSHARHMPTHIFIQHGMWDLVSGHNQSAYDVAVELWEPGDPLGDAVHSLDWGQYGDLQMGDYEKARLWMRRLDEMVEQEGFAEGGARGAAGMSRALGSVPLLKARYIVETEEWETQPVTDESSAHELLATAVSAWRLGKPKVVAAAEEALAKEGKDAGYDYGYRSVMRLQAGALRQAMLGAEEKALELMDEAVREVEGMALPRGAANPVKPVHELYGELLLALEMPDRARESFETSLLRMPNRPRSLLGLARAQASLGDAGAAFQSYRKVVKLWKGREGIAGLDEAREFTMRWTQDREGTANASPRG